MRMIDVYWTPIVNRITVVCDCGQVFTWPTSISVVECYSCGKQELWHPTGPVKPGSKWDYPVMKRDL